MKSTARLPATLSASLLALGLGATAPAWASAGLDPHGREGPHHGHRRHVAQRLSLDDYGRGYGGYDTRAHYGAIAIRDGQTSRPRRWRRFDGFPVYVYPLNAAIPIRSDSEYEQFRREEQEAAAVDGLEETDALGNHCETPVLFCKLNSPAAIGGGCSCKTDGAGQPGDASPEDE